MRNQSNIILTGPPRSGTTLACHLLNKIENVIALHEPMHLQMFSPPVNIPEMISNFFGEMRKEIHENGRALSKLSFGSIPDNPFGEGSEGRKSIVKKDYFDIDKPLTENFSLYIKHNAHFTFCLEELVDRYPIYVIIRNPISTLASWSSIDAPVAEGRVRVLYHLKPELAKKLDAITDVTFRQINLLDLHFQQYLKWKEKLIFIKYEDIISSGGKTLTVINSNAENLDEPLESKNNLSRYGKKKIPEWIDRIMSPNLSFWSFYNKDEILDSL